MSFHPLFTDREMRKVMEKFMGSGFPFLDQNKMKDWMKQPTWVKDIVKDAMDQVMKAMPDQEESEFSKGARSSRARGERTGRPVRPGRGGSTASRLREERIAETEKFLFVRIPLSSKVNPYALRLYVAPGQVRVEGLPEGQKHTIRLPREVGMVGIRAVFRDNLLRIKLPKKVITGKERQINIAIE
jgi:hypothetical protein